MATIEDLENKLNALYELLLSKPKKCEYTVEEWAEKWLTTFMPGKIRTTTYERYGRIIRNINKVFGDMLISDFDVIEAQRRLNTIESPATKDDCYALLMEMFEKAARIRLIDYNPIKALEITKHQKKHGKAFSTAQEQAFITACESNKRGLAFIICIYTGLRRGELLALTAEDINLDERTVFVSKQYIDGRITEPKTASSIRKVPIFDNLYKFLVSADLPKTGRLFQIKQHALREHFQNVLKEAGLNGQGFTIHSLRHTFITRCAEMGIARHIVQRWAGHATPDMTESVYTHINTDFEQRQIALYNSKLTE